MKKKYVRIVSCLLIGTMMIGALSGCSKEVVKVEPMEIEQVDSYSLDVIGGSDVMPIIGYYTPLTSWYSSEGSAPRDLLTDEHYKDIADSGVNLILSNPRTWQDGSTLTTKAMDFAAKYNMGVIVTDSSLNGSHKRGTEDPLTVEEALESMSNYMTHPGFAGIFLYDEPRTAYYQSSSDVLHYLDAYTEIARVLNDEIGVFTYQNLNGIGDSTTKDQFNQYLTEYCETQSPNYIMFDKYPFEPECQGKEYGYLYNLASFREYGLKYNIPWWSFIACGSQWNVGGYREYEKPYFPNEGQFDWCANMSLAFGAKGLGYFPMVQPYYYAVGSDQGVYDFEVNSMFGAWGNKTQYYYYTQDMNKQVQAVDGVLMNAVSKGVIAAGEEGISLCRDTRDALFEGTSWRELKDVSGDAVIGCFNYQGKTALYVVNASFDYAQKVTLSFVDTCNVKKVQAGETSYVKGDSLTLDMLAGDGVLLVFE